MANLILIYSLKEGVKPTDFEEWVRTVDQPAMRGLNRVTRFETYRILGHLMGGGTPSCSYVEVFELTDLIGFTGEDMGSSVVQDVMSAFSGFAEAPEFLIAETV